MARPSSFNQKTADAICERLTEGDTIRKICAEPGMPKWPTIRRWLNSVESFRTQYAQARLVQADVYADEIIDIADAKDIDPNDKRVMIDARKWRAAKLAPKVYSDKIAVGGADDLPPVRTVTQIQLVALTENDSGQD